MDMLIYHYSILSVLMQMSRCVGVCIRHMSGSFHTHMENLMNVMVQIKSICVPILVRSHPSTHLPVPNAMAGEVYGGTNRKSKAFASQLLESVLRRNPGGHCWLVSVMSMLATLTQPPVELQQCWSISQ